VRPLEDFVGDLRFSLRTLRKNPAFAGIAILSLAIGTLRLHSSGARLSQPGPGYVPGTCAPESNMFSRPSQYFPAADVPAGNGTKRQVLIGPDQGPNFALRKFIMEPGGGMPLHTNTVEHEQYVLRGRARVVIGDEVMEVEKDDVVYIPGGIPHSYRALGDEPFEFLCVVPNLPDETTIIQEDD
jgi:quercetin dioxygenase-like cupin family protein